MHPRSEVPRDVFTRLDRCRYCNRAAVIAWDTDLRTCNEEICKTLAFAQVRRWHPDEGVPLPETQLAHALLAALDTLDYTIGRDEQLEVVGKTDAQRMRDRERQETAWLLSDLRNLSRRYPAPARPREPRRIPRSNPRFRRFVRRGRTVPLRHVAA